MLSLVLKFLVAAFIIWPLFVLAAPAGYLTGTMALLLSLILPKRADVLRRYTSRVLHAQDCAAAAFLGWSGRDTVSKECGRALIAGTACRFCRYTCAALDLVDPDHCKREGEGA